MTPREYREQVFTPLLKEWKATGLLPTVYQRYGLALEESDLGAIEKRVIKVRGFWGGLGNSADHSMQTLIALLRYDESPREDGETRVDGKKNGDPLVALQDASQREKLVTQERARIEAMDPARLNRLQAALRVLGTKRYVTPGEKAALENQFPSPLVDQVLKSAGLPIQERPSVVAKLTGPNDDTWQRVRNNLRATGDDTLLSFLRWTEEQTPTKEQWKQLYEKAYKEWLLKKKDHKQTAAKDLLGLIKSQFVDGDISGYQDFLRWERQQPLRELVSVIAAGKRINPQQFQLLVGQARQYSIPDPEESVLQLLEQRNMSVVSTDAVEFVSCPSCYGSLKGKEKQCGICGFHLWARCRRCNKDSWRAGPACSHCGFVPEHYERALQLTREVRQAIDGGFPVRALELIREVEEIWKRDEEVARLRALAENAISAAQGNLESIQRLCKSKRLFEAARQARELRGKANDFTAPGGDTVATVLTNLDDDLKKVDRELQDARKAEDQGKTKLAVLTYERALDLAIDAQQAVNALARMHPEPVAAVRAQLRGSSVLVEWDPSPAVGQIEYVLTRSEGQAAGSFDPKAVAGVTKALSFDDPKPRAGEVVSYAVFVRRHGSLSRHAPSPSLLIAPEAREVRAEAGDGFVRLHWAVLPANAKARVTRSQGSAANGAAEGPLLMAQSAGLKDEAVQNGREYFYRVRIEYADPLHGARLTPGVVVRATPQSVPKPVADLRVTPEAHGVSLKWDRPAAGSVEVYRSKQKPGWQLNANVSPAERSAQTRLSGWSATEARDTVPAGETVWYTPVTVHGDFAIAGESRRFRVMPEVTNFEVTDFGAYLQLRWSWPAGCDAVRVVWRKDRYATSPDEADLQSKQITLAAYNKAGSLQLKDASDAPHYFTAYAVVTENGESLFSSGAASRAAVRLTSAVDVTYRILHGTPNKGAATLVLKAAKSLRLPAMRLVANPGVEPLRADMGTLVTKLPEIQLWASKDHSQPISLPNNLPKPFFLRLFLPEPPGQTAIRLVAPIPGELKIS